MDTDQLVKGDRIYRYVWTGERNERQPLTVVRPNKKTVTADTDEGSRIRVSVADAIGYWKD